MKAKPLEISGSWEVELKKFDDSRGFFFESFRSDLSENFFGRNFFLPISIFYFVF